MSVTRFLLFAFFLFTVVTLQAQNQCLIADFRFDGTYIDSSSSGLSAAPAGGIGLGPDRFGNQNSAL